MELDRRTPPVIYQATDFEYALPRVQEHNLNDMVKLYWLNSGVQDVLLFEIYIPKSYSNQQDVALAKSVTALMKAGTTSKSALQISEEIEQVGAELSVSQNNDYYFVRLKCLSKHFTTLLPLINEILSDAQFPEEELEIYKQQAVQSLTINLKKSDVVANRMMDELIYGQQHPYGMVDQVADYKNLQRDQLLTYYKQHIHLANASFFLSGKYPNHILENIKSEFGAKLKIASHPASQELTISPNPKKFHRIINDENALQGAIRITNTFIDRQHPDFIPMLFVNTLFGGYFGSRLMSNIREDKGYTYGIYSFIQQNKLHNSYIIATDVGKDVAELAVQEVWHEMNRLRTELVGDEELQLVKNYILGSVRGSLDGPFKIMGRWKKLILNNQQEDYFYNSIAVFKSITADEVRTLANQYFQQAQFYDLIVY